MILYLIKSTLTLSLLYCCFAVLLSRETFHKLNRLLLVGTLWMALFLPLIHLAPIHSTAGGRLLASSVTQLQGSVGFLLVVTPDQQMSLTWDRLLLGIYLLGVVFALVVKTIQAIRLCRFMSGGLRHTDSMGNTVILKTGDFQPFSFLHYIMMNVTDYNLHRNYILPHEQEHIRLGHSYDQLLLELVKTIQWFNPFVWMLEQDLKTIHEYEADMAVIKKGIDAKAYQQLLVVKVMGNRLQPFSNNLSHGSLKKRIFMMYQKKSNRWKMLKALCIIPVSGLALYVFATPETTIVPKMEASVMENVLFQTEEKDSIYWKADVLPKYGDGEMTLYEDLSTTLRYPKLAMEMGVQGKVILSFVVDKNGNLVDITSKSLDVPGNTIVTDKNKGKEQTEEDIQKYAAAVKALQEEAVRTLKALPGKWHPGLVKDEPVSVHFNLPITFRLN